MSKFRYRLIQVFLLIAFVAIALRLAQFQILEGTKHANYVKNSGKHLQINAARGEIVDRNEKVLALDLTKYTLEYNPVDTSEDRYRLGLNLNRICNFRKYHLLRSKYSQTLAHNLSRDQASQIRKLKSKLLYLRKMRSRFYPQGDFASHILGYVDLYGEARKGIELRYQDLLKKNPQGKLDLSIDSRLQVFAEKALNKRIAETNALRGTVMVMNVKTGEILAWAVSPSFDPNKYYNYNLEAIKNWSIVDVYQPGSIFKIVTVSSALDSGTITPDHRFVDQGFLKVDTWTIKNHDYVAGKTGSRELNLQGLFERSSNPFASHLGLLMGPQTFYRYIRKFGFSAKTRIELDGETKGILHHFSKWYKSDTATTGMGQGAISVTPIQILAAVNVIPNGGIWVKPTLLKVDKTELEKLEQHVVLKPSTANLIRELLTRSIETNNKERNTIAGNIPGLKVAGKTGTAQKAEGRGYSKSRTIASFVGFYPAENPRFITLVVIDDPKAAGGWGDTVSGPVFNQVASYVRDLYL